jgi:hypothetical protein
MEETMSEENELVVVNPVDIPALFEGGGCDPIVERLKKEAAKFKGDITTAKGRKEIASFARKFSSAKVYLDGLGKALSDEYRAKIAPINTERNKIEACCNELRDVIRKPLTDWEDAEKERVAKHEAAIQLINDQLEVDIEDSSHARRVLDSAIGIVVDDAFEEFELAATKAKAAVIEQLEAKFIVLQNKEREAAEAERLEKERLEKEQKDREETIAREAAEKATKEAEEKARVEAEEAERKVNEERERLEKEKLEEKLKAETAEREQLEAKERHKAELDAKVKETEERLKREEAEERAREEKKAANKAHRGKINRAAKESLVAQGFDDDDAEKIVTVIAQGLIDNITINY